MQDVPTDKPEGHDEIEASKAPLMDHLIELRQRLIYALIGIGIGFVICFAFATDIYNLLVWPYQVARGAGQKIEMIYTAPHEFFFTKLKLALFGAVFLAFPLIAMQIYKFVAPGLYKNERAAFRPYLLWTFVLFITGALVVYFIVMPLAMMFFLSMEQTGGQVEIHLQARVSEYLSLIMTLILGFGIMFQLPVVLSLLAQAGIVTRAEPARLPPLRHRRHHGGGRRALPARPLQHDRHGAAHHPALRGRHPARRLGGEAARRQGGRRRHARRRPPRADVVSRPRGWTDRTPAAV